ncbi:MAG: hypothetical protein PHU85_04460 [Phycisphaerae bacterium]|nr:hypothetical protein [Phycisphaerae bacterium]
MTTVLALLEKAVERATGESAETLRNTPVDDRRRQIERTNGVRLRFTSKFPFIGRGNVLRDRIVDHAFVERALKEALRDDNTR